MVFELRLFLEDEANRQRSPANTGRVQFSLQNLEERKNAL